MVPDNRNSLTKLIFVHFFSKNNLVLLFAKSLY